MLHPAFYVVLGHAAGALLLGWCYFRRFRLARPPLGILTLGDVAVMLGGIVLVPYLYLYLPRWFAAGLLGLALANVLVSAWEPVLHSRRAAWAVVLVLLGADVGTAIRHGATSAAFFAVNNLVLVLAVVGLANLWAQGGMRARDAAVLGGFLALYDVVATSLLPLTDDLLGRLVGLPFAPLVAWPIGGTGRLGIGLGDLLLATLFPLVARKAFGRVAGLAAAGLGLGTLGALLLLADCGVARSTVPTMAALGPLMVLHFLYWRRRRGSERTTRQYQREEPTGEPATSSARAGRYPGADTTKTMAR